MSKAGLSCSACLTISVGVAFTASRLLAVSFVTFVTSLTSRVEDAHLLQDAEGSLLWLSFFYFLLSTQHDSSSIDKDVQSAIGVVSNQNKTLLCCVVQEPHAVTVKLTH